MTDHATVAVGEHALRLATSGSGDRPFLCLHGLVDTLSIWDRLAGRLAERGRVLRYDQRGHGGSDSPPGPYKRADLAGDAVAVLDAVGVDRAILVGHSMGGIVSMATALLYPERVSGLVLLGTASHCNEKTADWYEKIALAGERDGCPGIARSIYGRKSARGVNGDARGIAAMTRMLKSLYSDPLTPRLDAVSCPTLLLVGEKDPMGPRASERIAEALPSGSASLVTVPDCGHWVHVGETEAVVRSLDTWLADTGL